MSRILVAIQSISSSTTQIVKYLIKDGSSELAMAAMMQAVPNGKDFIISNQKLNYTLKENNQNTPKYKYSSPFDYGDVYTLTQARNHLKRSLNEYPGEGNYFITVCIDLKEKYECYWGNKGEESEPLRSVYFSRTSNDEYNSKVKSKTLSLKTIANKIINLANQENPAAKDYIAASNQDLVDNDEKKRKSLAKELNQKEQTTSPNNHIVLKDGFYSVDGLKISEKYYNYLWKNGRKAPFLQAREILASNPKITPDPRGAIGYLRYEANGLEMIYNPETGQIGHIQPIRGR